MIVANQNLSQYPAKFVKKARQPSEFLTSLNRKVKESSATQRAFGRKREVDLISQTLLRRKKANPILIGEAGTGKTAIVEELAHLIVNGEIHQDLEGIEILELDVNGLIAGTATRGSYEERVVEILKQLEEMNDEVIVFIDEIHHITHTDGTSKDTTNTFGEMIKPALVKGTFKCIGATTPDEYYKSFSKNAALQRRFQKVEISEPNSSQTLEILKNAITYFEKHHCCQYSEESLKVCVEIAYNYIPHRQFPDKAFDLIDEVGSMHCIDVSNGSRQKIDCIDREYVVKFATKHLGFDLSHLMKGGNPTYNHDSVKKTLKQKIIGQDYAIDEIIKCFVRKDCGLRDTNRPIASVLLSGRSGIGKSELAKSIAEQYNYSLVVLDMGEYMTSNSASTLIGTPPGYVGFEDSGHFTKKIKQNPRSIIVFENVEKAHPYVYNLLLQIMDEGRLSDSQGNSISFSNAVIILTVTIEDDSDGKGIGFDINSESDIHNSTDNYVSSLFRPEFLNRIDLKINLRSLTIDDLRKIAKNCIEATIRRVMQVDSSLKIPSQEQDLNHYVNELMSTNEVNCPRSIQRHVEKLFVDPRIQEILENEPVFKK